MLLGVLVVGVMARVELIPLFQGQDFVVWDRATAATLDGVNIYTHHPAYPGGPYAYLPLFLYVELPFQWLAQHTGVGFVVLGKLPILAGDIACALLIADAVAARSASRRTVALATAAFFLNPLVLYNSAYYGRFDSIGCALLLLALRALRMRERHSARGAGWYGLAVAAKTFPGFAAVGVFRAARGARVRAALMATAVIGAVLLPYANSLHAVVTDVVGYDMKKLPQGLSWQTLLLRVVDSEDARLISYILLGVFVAATIWLSRLDELDRYLLLTLVLFLCLSKVVLEQYLTWPLPWLAIAAFAPGAAGRRTALALLGALTAIGCLDNASYHPWGQSPTFLAVGLVCVCLGYVAVQLRTAPNPVAAAT